MTPRTFAAHRFGDTTVVYDPLTGLTHQTDRSLPDGRTPLDPAEVVPWPVVHPGQLGWDWPISVCWSPLVRCNLACPHCLDDKTLPEQPPVERQRVAVLLAESGILGVDISGGEPLLLRDLGELISTLTARGIAVSVTTNGWHLTRRAQALAGTVDAIRVSLDGADADVHDRWRGAGSYARATAGLRAAVAYGIPVQIQTVLMRSTLEQAQHIVALAETLGASGVTFLQLLPLGDGAVSPGEELTDDQACATVDQLSVPTGLSVRVRTRRDAGGFSVVRADGRIWRNNAAARGITDHGLLRKPEDMLLSSRDGSA